MKVKYLGHILGKNPSYLTVGKVYDVVSVPGERSKLFPIHNIPQNTFEIINDDGQLSYGLTQHCAHGEWEIVEK